MSKDALYLITGATGQTGGFAAKQLFKEGHRVRAVAHRKDSRSRALEALGAEIVYGDLSDFQFVRTILIGIEAAYFVWPVLRGNIEAAAYFAQAAKDNGVKHIVNMSHIVSRIDSPSWHSQNQFVAERLFESYGLNVTHLRPTVFMDWILQQADYIRKWGMYATPFLQKKVALICSEDQGRVIVGVLLDPVPHRGKSYDLYGAKEQSFQEIIEEMNAALGYRVRLMEFTSEGFGKFGKFANLDPFTVQHVVVGGSVDYRNGLFTGNNDIVEKIGGRKPLTVTQYIEINRGALRKPWYRCCW